MTDQPQRLDLSKLAPAEAFLAGMMEGMIKRLDKLETDNAALAHAVQDLLMDLSERNIGRAGKASYKCRTKEGT